MLWIMLYTHNYIASKSLSLHHFLEKKKKVFIIIITIYFCIRCLRIFFGDKEIKSEKLDFIMPLTLGYQFGDRISMLDVADM